MSMPASGNIALRTCILGITCSSISCAVANVACSPASLVSLSVQASKAAPHAMSEFYGYAAAATTTTTTTAPQKQVGLCAIGAGTGTLGTSLYVTRAQCICVNPAITAGQCFNFTIEGNLCNLGGGSSYSCVVVVCNSSPMCYCTAYSGQTCNYTTGNIIYRFGDTMHLCEYACNAICSCPALITTGCLDTVTQVVGYFARVNPTPYCTVNTGGDCAGKIISFSCLAGTGTLGVSDCVSRTLSFTSTPAMVAGECYTFTMCGSGYVPIGSGGYACICFICNTVPYYACSMAFDTTYNSGPLTMRYGDSMCAIISANNVESGTYAPSIMWNCLCGVTGVVGVFSACAQSQAPSTFCFVNTAGTYI